MYTKRESPLVWKKIYEFYTTNCQVILKNGLPTGGNKFWNTPPLSIKIFLIADLTATSVDCCEFDRLPATYFDPKIGVIVPVFSVS